MSEQTAARTSLQCTLQLSLQGKISLAKKKKKSVSKRFDLVSLYLRLFLGHFRRLFRVADFFLRVHLRRTLLDVNLVRHTRRSTDEEVEERRDVETGVALDLGESVLELIAALLEEAIVVRKVQGVQDTCLLYTSPSPRDRQKSRMPSSA